MYLIIVGCGKIGSYLAQLLLEEGHDVMAVDANEEVCKKVSEELDIEIVHGDGKDPKVLEKLEIKEADAIVALTSSDETNMVVSLVSKELGAKQVAARIEKIEYNESVLKKLGIDIVIHPQAAAAGYIAEILTNPQVLDLAFISKGGAKILELEIKDNSKLVGKELSEVKMPEGSNIIALIKNEELVLPSAGTQIGSGDAVMVIAKKEAAEKVKKALQ